MRFDGEAAQSYDWDCKRLVENNPICRLISYCEDSWLIGRIVTSPGVLGNAHPCGNDLGHVLPLYVSFIRTHTYIWPIRRIVYFSFQLHNLRQSRTYTKPPPVTVVLGPILPTPTILLSPSLHFESSKTENAINQNRIMSLKRHPQPDEEPQLRASNRS